MKDIIDEFEHAIEATDNNVAAAILVLARVVRDKSVPFDRGTAENFGHELALALKNVIAEGGSISIRHKEAGL